MQATFGKTLELASNLAIGVVAILLGIVLVKKFLLAACRNFGARNCPEFLHWRLLGIYKRQNWAAYISHLNIFEIRGINGYRFFWTQR